MADLKPLRTAIDSMSADLFAVIGVPFENTTELQRQLMASFAFGMAFAVGKSEGLLPPEVHALSITMLIDSFRYSEEQAGAFSQHLIECASGAGNPTIHAVIHRGIDGHRQWQTGARNELRENIQTIFEAVGA